MAARERCRSRAGSSLTCGPPPPSSHQHHALDCVPARPAFRDLGRAGCHVSQLHLATRARRRTSVVYRLGVTECLRERTPDMARTWGPLRCGGTAVAEGRPRGQARSRRRLRSHCASGGGRSWRSVSSAATPCRLLADPTSYSRRATFIGDANAQVAQICAQLLDLPEIMDPALNPSRKFDAIGFSQGGQLLRALVERCGGKRGLNVRNLITVGAQHVSSSARSGGEAVLTRICRWVFLRCPPALQGRAPSEHAV